MASFSIGDADRLRSQVAALEQLLSVYENAAVEQSERLVVALDELRRLRGELELQVQDRTAELTRAVAELKAEIDERRRAEETLKESEARFRSVAETATDAIICVDGKGAIVFWNRSAERMFGFPAAEILDAPLQTIIPERFRSGHAIHWSQMLGRPSSVIGRTVTVVGRRKDGSEFPAELSVGAFMTRQGSFFAGVVRDVSERKRAEQFRDEYLSLVAHDLRNPLTSIMGRAGALRGMLAAAGLEPAAESADAILRSTRRMNAMLEDLVESVRLESGQLVLHRKPTRLEALVHDVVARMGTASDRERLAVEVLQPLPLAEVDPERIERALVNLLSNALKFSAPGTPVTVSLVHERDDVSLSVTDRGVGIPPEDLPHLFQRFRTVKSSEKHSLGLGLYITRLVAEAHGGHVSVESAPGRGSTFRLSLPLKVA